MRYLTMFVVTATLLVSEIGLAAASTPITALTQDTVQERAANMRAQLSELEKEQAELQTRLQKLDEDLKPENIEHSLAGIGSTHPEQEREQRRRQLEIERKGVQKQLDLLATSHTRLETAIARAETDAYHQSAAPVAATVTPTSTTTTSPSAVASTGATITPERPRRLRRKRARRSKRVAQQQTTP